MGNVTDNKFTWVIKNSSAINYSGEFMIGGCKWNLGTTMRTKSFSLYLVVHCYQSLPCGWRIHAKFRIIVVNQLSERLSHVEEKQHWFDRTDPIVYYPEIIPLTLFHDKDGGFRVNNEVKIVAEIDVLEVIGNFDFSMKSQAKTQPRKKTKLNDGGGVSCHFHTENSSGKESIDVNGFQVLPSQAESVKRIFEKHPNMALNFRAKNQTVRTACMNALLSLIETLCQSLQDLSIDDLGQADNALTYLKNSGFKVDWLERKLEEVKGKKIEEEVSETRMQELEAELKGFEQKYSDIEALLEKKKEELKDLKKKCLGTEALLKKEKAKVLAARAPPLTLDDVV